MRPSRPSPPGIYLNTGSLGPIPAEAAAAMAEVAERELRVGRAHVDAFPESLERMAEARAAVAAVLTTDPSTIAITHSATDGINAVAAAIDWAPGDVAVTTRLEHPGGLGPLYALRARGIETRFVDIGGGDDDERTLREIDAALSGRVRLFVVSHVAWTTGAILPVAALVELAHQRGAIVVIDGAQSVGAVAVDVEAIGADAYAVAGQKWLLGPEGMGALHVRRRHDRATDARDSPAIAPRTCPWIWSTAASGPMPGASSGRGITARRSSGWPVPSAGCRCSSGCPGSTSAAPPWPATRRSAWRASTGVTVLTPLDQMATLVTFRIAGWPAAAALTELGARTFAIARTIEHLDALRISVGFFTSEDELEPFAAGRRAAGARTRRRPSRRDAP